MSFPSHLFITGTDTEVGKSVVTAALAASAIGPVTALKPIASGVPAGESGSDARLIGYAAQHAPQELFTWEEPLSPHRAAENSGLYAHLGETLAWIREKPCSQLLVEGVGGWRVPIGWDWGVPELAKGLGYPVLVVAANRLGVLNHTLLTIESIRSRGLKCVGVVLNNLHPPEHASELSQRHNLEDLQQLLPHLAVVGLPYLRSFDRKVLAEAGQAIRKKLS